jgi:hypothetical protein
LNRDTFDTLILIGRPASGKSEIIDYLNSFDAEERRRRFHLGELFVADDFPMLWTWFEEDRLLSQMGKPRLHTDEKGYFKHEYLWDLLVRRLCLEYEKHRTEKPEGITVIIEFSRGSSHGGYSRAFGQLSTRILAAAVVLYVNVSFGESMRKNRRRFNPQAPHSILEHSLPEEKLRHLYQADDWARLSGRDSRFLSIGDAQVPYTVFENEKDYTTCGGTELDRRLALCCEQLRRLAERTIRPE